MFGDSKRYYDDCELDELTPNPPFVGTSISEEDEDGEREEFYGELFPTRELESWPPPPRLRKPKE